MKSLFFSAALSLCSFSALAAKVAPGDAVAYAGAYLRNVVRSDLRPVSAAPIVFHGSTALYVVSLVPEGWIIVAADDVIAPIVGYSESGALAADSLDSNFRSYLGAFADDIDIRSAQGDLRSPAWAADTVPSTNKVESAVSPLIEVEWNQGGKYRQYCPTGQIGDAIVGCVAVGMGQAMSHYRMPAKPVGSKSFNSANYGPLSVDYDSEPDYDWSEIIGAQQKDNDGKECARLLYHCGMSVEMNYGPGESGVSFMGVVPYALKTYFGYSNKVRNVSKKDYSTSEWADLLKNELSAGRPLIYAGYSTSGGHCFNVDGYNAQGLFHFNFGWGGNGNGYMSITSHAYTDGERCTLNFAPATGKPMGVLLSKESVAKGVPAGTVVATLTADTDKDGCEFSFEVSGVENPVTHIAPDPVFDVDGDKLVTNSLFAEKYGVSSKAKVVSVNIKATNVETLDSYTQKVSVSLSSSSALGDVRDALSSVSCSGGSIAVVAAGGAVTVSVVAADGKIVGSASLAPFATAAFDGLAGGIYVVRVADGVSSRAAKVLVK
ncbi:MAG: C10 family peptidase [Marinilabiliaceae bacterium]